MWSLGRFGVPGDGSWLPDHLIENREVLRERPPDILFTNYKMLDLLLKRPIDFPLWRPNAARACRAIWWWTSCTLSMAPKEPTGSQSNRDGGPRWRILTSTV